MASYTDFWTVPLEPLGAKSDLLQSVPGSVGAQPRSRHTRCYPMGADSPQPFLPAIRSRTHHFSELCCVNVLLKLRHLAVLEGPHVTHLGV